MIVSFDCQNDSGVAAGVFVYRVSDVSTPTRLLPRLAVFIASLSVISVAFVSTGCVSDQKSVAAAQPAASFDIPATDDGLPGAGPIRRADWFKKTWSERRQSFAATAAKDHGSVVFLGDSITQGWGENLSRSFPGTAVSNRGISGDTSRGLLVRLNEDVLALKPRAVVLLIGTNDLEEGADPEIIAGNVKLLLASIRQQDPNMPVVLCAVFPSSTSKKRPAAQIKRLNELYRGVIHGQTQVTYVDTWTLFADPEGDAKLAEFPDLLHPNADGYAKWTGALRPLFATLDLLDTQPDNFKPEPGFVSLFNGQDLTGWCYLPSTPQDLESARNWQKSDPAAPPWPVVKDTTNFDRLAKSPDGRYVAKNGRLVVTSPTEYRKIQKIWTQREFPRDFVLKLEFRALPNSDSGIYLRAPQLQCRDYLLAGPYKELKNYKAGDWNEIIVTVKDNVAHCTCNGEVIEAAMKLPETGPIGLEGDRGQMEYRRIRVSESAK